MRYWPDKLIKKGAGIVAGILGTNCKFSAINVYTVYLFEDYEGPRLLGTYSTLKNARFRIKTLKRKNPKGDYRVYKPELDKPINDFGEFLDEEVEQYE